MATQQERKSMTGTVQRPHLKVHESHLDKVVNTNDNINSSAQVEESPVPRQRKICLIM